MTKGRKDVSSDQMENGFIHDLISRNFSPCVSIQQYKDALSHRSHFSLDDIIVLKAALPPNGSEWNGPCVSGDPCIQLCGGLHNEFDMLVTLRRSHSNRHLLLQRSD
ncbi:hypothetical protein DNTS_004932 [Danionella cerebrum]|uniref:Uncharacterized protein n=1 Tax=Danionella cerebrum TaxID=2873325 RepID=A0A553MZC6_9TELE|nr:hypothetical protein DNTS_004932 [Danionella translucida]